MFTWDVGKAIVNFEKHKISFEEAASVFTDEMGFDWQDIDHSEKENRRKRLGLSIESKILLVVYTIRRFKNGKETIRIISDRFASRKERKSYFE